MKALFQHDPAQIEQRPRIIRRARHHGLEHFNCVVILLVARQGHAEGDGSIGKIGSKFHRASKDATVEMEWIQN